MLWCVIPARNGSKGVPEKNWKPLPDGSTCVGRALAIAEKFAQIEQRILVVDAPKCFNSPVAYVIAQPRLCAEGGGSMLALMLYAMIEVRAEAEDWVMLLQPTSPFRTEATGRELMEQFQLRAGDYDSICTAMPYPDKWNPAYRLSKWDTLPVRRQQLPGAMRPDGGYYLTTVEHLYECDGWGDMGWIESPAAEQLSIDTPEDWAEAERRVKAGA